MRKINGHNQESVEGNFRKTFMGNRYLNGCLVAICLIVLTTGCSTIKKAGIIGASAGLGATAGSVISGGAIAPIAGSMIAASVASAATTGLGTGEPTQALEITGDATIVQEAPSNFFDLLGELISMGGWLLILIVVVPMVLGWIIPGPLTTHKKKR
mgnify:CR=1 FL=1|jgi:hypothetical protein